MFKSRQGPPVPRGFREPFSGVFPRFLHISPGVPRGFPRPPDFSMFSSGSSKVFPVFSGCQGLFRSFDGFPPGCSHSSYAFSGASRASYGSRGSKVFSSFPRRLQESFQGPRVFRLSRRTSQGPGVPRHVQAPSWFPEFFTCSRALKFSRVSRFSRSSQGFPGFSPGGQVLARSPISQVFLASRAFAHFPRTTTGFCRPLGSPLQQPPGIRVIF